jgi:HEAT repeat protein
MKSKHLLGVVVALIGVILGLRVLTWVWAESEKPLRPPTTSELIDQAQSGDTAERRAAVLGLSRERTSDLVAVVLALIGALADPEASVRNDAAVALGQYLVAVSKDGGQASIVLARAGASSLIKVLKEDHDSSVRASAAFAVTSLLRGLKECRINSGESMPGDSIDPRTTIKALGEVLERDPAARPALLFCFHDLGPIDGPAPSVVLDALDDPERVMRVEALKAVAQFTRDNDNAVSALLREVDSYRGDPFYRRTTYNYQLREIAERLRTTTAIVPQLMIALESDNPDVRSIAALLLGGLGQRARSAAPSLIVTTTAMIRSASRAGAHAEDSLFSDLASALVEVASPDEAVPVLSEVLGPDRPAMAARAARCLGKLGAKGGSAVPHLLKAFKAAGDSTTALEDGEYAHAILRSLWDIVPNASLPKSTVDEVIGVMSSSLDFPQGFNRRTAADALGDFGPRAAVALPRLHALVDSEKAGEVREAAAKAITKIEPVRRAPSS